MGDIASWCVKSGLGSGLGNSYLMSCSETNRKLYIGGKELTGELIIPNGVTSIGAYAFYECNGLTSITIPDSVTSIGENAFYNCSGLTSVTIGKNLTSIGEYAFFLCDKLVEVYNKSSMNITKGSSNYGYLARNAKNVFTPTNGESKLSTTEEGYIIYTDDGVTSLIGYTGTDTELTLPHNIINIYKYAFSNCDKLTSITIPDSVTSIGMYAFYYCSGLTSITIPNSVTSIGGSTFHGCSGLEEITIPFVGGKAGITSSDKYQYPFGYIFSTNSYAGGMATEQAYYKSSTSSTTTDTYYIPTSLKKVTITGGSSILRGAFYGCSGITSITIPDSVISIGTSAFFGCYKLVEVYNKSPLNITKGSNENGSIAYYAKDVYTSEYVSKLSTTEDGYIIYTDGEDNILIGYTGTKSELILPSGITAINQYAFYNCDKLTSITIPNSVRSIGKNAFYKCSGLTSITIPDSVTNIEDYTFFSCSGLTKIIIPYSVTSIGYQAFDYCSGLTSIYYCGSPSDWNGISISNNNTYLTSATRYYYSEEEPTLTGNYWHYVDGVVTEW